MACITSEELQEKAKNELREDPYSLQEYLNYIREWFKQQPHLFARTEDLWIIIFLRGCKYNLEKTKKRIDLHYTCKTMFPEFFYNRDPLLQDIQHVLTSQCVMVLPKTAGPTGPKLIFFRAKYFNPEFMNIQTLTKTIFMFLDILCMQDPSSTVSGLSILVDLSDLNYNQINQIASNSIENALTCLKGAHPLRIKAVYIINAPIFFKPVYNVIQMASSDKLKQRFKFYSKIEDVFHELPQSIFPKDYGGEQSCCDDLIHEWKLKVEHYRNWYLDDERYHVEEERRVESLFVVGEVLQVEDLFKTLEINRRNY